MAMLLLIFHGKSVLCVNLSSESRYPKPTICGTILVVSESQWVDHRLIFEHISFAIVIVATPSLDVKTVAGGTRKRKRRGKKVQALKKQ